MKIHRLHIMKHFILFIAIYISISIDSSGQSVVGIWKNIEKNKLQSHIEIYLDNDRMFAKVIKLFPTSEVTHCHKCKGGYRGASLKDIILIKDMKAKKDKWVDGKILDPKSGKEYDCNIELKDNNTLKVRGYIVNPLFGKTFYWYRVK